MGAIMHQVFCRNNSQSTEALAVADAVLGKGDRRLLTTQGDLLESQTAEAPIGHVLAPRSIAADDDVFLHDTLGLFDSPGYHALLRFWASFVPNGRIVIPEFSMAGGFGGSHAEAMFGPASMSKEIGKRRYHVHDGCPWQPSGSIVDWWARRGMDVVQRQCDSTPWSFEESKISLETAARFEIPGDEAIRSMAALGITQASSTWSYQIWAALAKVAVIRWIIGEFDAPATAGHLDIGAGPGLIGAELLLDASLGVSHSLGLEIDARGPWSGCLLAGSDAASLGSRWRFRLGSAATWRSSSPVGICTALGSLLYLPRSEAGAVLDEAWSNLEPGGLLIVHENMKHRRFVQDHACMFDRGELERMLGRYGEIRFVGATSCRHLTAAEVGEKTIFRIVVKRG
jgi:hypothetical protein